MVHNAYRYTHVCMHVYTHVFMKSSFFLVEKRRVHCLPKLPAEYLSQYKALT